jgi:hypothetical protein
LLVTRETRQQRERRLAEALRRNLGRRKQASRDAKPYAEPNSSNDGENNTDEN